ncbi:MAG: leucine-rich repeat domain-containing protein [Clostridia bacterium]|nr:leucine-rich repeat domain-containing protein [Clostridia bacterium]
MKKKLFLTLLCVVLAVFALSITAAAADVQVGKLWYSLDSSKQTAALTASNATQDFTNEDGTLGDIVIPSEITVGDVTYAVTAIDSHAFSGAQSSWGKNQTIKSVVIPASVSSIGAHVFRECKSLEAVTIYAKNENGIKLSDAEFYNCTGLKSVDMEKSDINNFVQYTFYNCNKLATFKYPPKLTNIGGQCFRLCSSLTNGDLSNTQVASLGGGAFWDCKAITNFIFPSTLTSISSNAIQETGVTTLVLPHSVTTLNNDCIANNRSLYMLFLPEIAESNTGINAGAIHEYFPKVVIYSGDTYSHLLASGALFSSYTAKPFSEFDPNTTYTTKTFFYGADTCSKCNGMPGEKEFVFEGATLPMKDQELCTHCGFGDVTSYPAIITPLGYSYSYYGDSKAIDSGIAIDFEALELYNSKVPEESKITSYGLVAVLKANVGDGTAFDANGERKAGVIQVAFSEKEIKYDIISMNIGGFTDEEYNEVKLTDTEVYIAAYYFIDGKAYYITGKTEAQSLSEAVTYNQLYANDPANQE